MSCISARAGKLDAALKNLSKLTSKLGGIEYSGKLVNLCCRISNIYREVGDLKFEDNLLEAADVMVKRMADVDGSSAQTQQSPVMRKSKGMSE